MIAALDHVQVAMPAGEEERARDFYSGLLGLDELEKPAALPAPKPRNLEPTSLRRRRRP